MIAFRPVLILLVFIWSYVPGIWQTLHKNEHHAEEAECVLSYTTEDPDAQHLHQDEEEHCALCEFNFQQDTCTSTGLPALIFSFYENPALIFLELQTPKTHYSLRLRGPPVLT